MIFHTALVIPYIAPYLMILDFKNLLLVDSAPLFRYNFNNTICTDCALDLKNTSGLLHQFIQVTKDLQNLLSLSPKKAHT